MEYRNLDAQKIRALLYPPGLQTNAIAALLDLFPDHLREFPELDYLIENTKTLELGLPHVTRNNFRF